MSGERGWSERIQRELDGLYELAMDEVASGRETVAHCILIHWGALNRALKDAQCKEQRKEHGEGWAVLQDDLREMVDLLGDVDEPVHLMTPHAVFQDVVIPRVRRLVEAHDE